jgi:hypothetical protein
MNRYKVDGEPEVHEDGDFVSWEDYEKLEAELATTRQELSSFESAFYENSSW